MLCNPSKYFKNLKAFLKYFEIPWSLVVFLNTRAQIEIRARVGPGKVALFYLWSR